MKQILYYRRGAALLTTALLLLLQYSFAQQKPSSIHIGVLKGISPELRNLPTSFPPRTKQNREFGEKDPANKRIRVPVYNPNAVSTDGALYTPPEMMLPTTPFAPALTFNGNGQSDNAALGFGNLTPPDPCMAVGPNHVVQMINLAHSVYDKNGVKLNGPIKFSSIAPGAGDDGDPIVLYDHMADRWMLLQFSDVLTGNDRLIFCISQTPDPAGAYYVYSFSTPNLMPDYPHIAIWGNAFLITTHEFGLGAGNPYLGQGFYAVDRKAMLAGSPTSTLIRFNDANQGGYLPASMEGLKMHDATALPTFCSVDADEWGAPADRLMLRTMSIDFNTPANSSLSATTFLNTASFDGNAPASRNAIEQSGTSNGLDAIADRMMSRVIYRRFDNYESMVMNHVVNVSGTAVTGKSSYQAAMRWYELRRPGPGNPWTIHQQSTYAPYTINGNTGMNAWMGSIGIDQKGSVALAYSASSSSTFPSLHYALRYENDVPGALSAQQTFHAGGGSQTNAGFRWGDYSAMTTDPTNEDTLWFTGEYYSATSSANFNTRIGKFTIDLPPSAPTVHFKTGGTLAQQKDANTPVPGSTCLSFRDYPIVIQIDQAPSQPVNLTLQTAGTATLGSDYDLINASPITLNAGNLTHTLTLRVYDNGAGEPDETLELSYTLNNNGGNGTAAPFNQKHLITIFGTPGEDPNSLIVPVFGSPTTVFTEVFDGIASGLGPWTQTIVSGTSPNNFTVNTSGGTGFAGKSLYISNNGSAYSYSASTSTSTEIRVASPLIDITGKGLVNVTFKIKCNGETPNWDYGKLQYSADGGTTWVDATGMIMGVTTATFQTIALPTVVKDINNLRIGFLWKNDNSVQNQPPLGVDSITVTASPFTLNSAIQTAVNSLTIGTENFGPFQTTHFIDPVSNKVMATLVNNSAHNFGCTKVEVDRAGTSAVDFSTAVAADRVASKTFKITPEFNNVNASYTLKLYYEEGEVAGWESATAQNRNNAKIVKVQGNNHIGDVTPANQASFPYTLHAPVLGAFGTDGVTFQHTFASGGFSGFGIGIPQPQNALPVTLVTFTGKHQSGTGNLLQWLVTEQQQVARYEVEHSADGTTFRHVGTVQARMSKQDPLPYDFLHVAPAQGRNYYRLRIVDEDGRYEYSHVVLLTVDALGRGLVLYPNPTGEMLYIQLQGMSGRVDMQVLNAQGQVVKQMNADASGQIMLSLTELPKGMYILRAGDGRGNVQQRFIKQ
jgi:hypothetical protein